MYINFNNIVREVAEPVLSENGFILDSEEEGYLRYLKDKSVIVFSYDSRRSCEVSVNFGLKDAIGEYNIADLLRYFSGSVPNSYDYLQFVDVVKLKDWLVELSDFLKMNLPNVVENWDFVYCSIIQKKREINQKYARESCNKLVNSKIDQLWRNKDYRGLVNFIDSQNLETVGVVKKEYIYSLKSINNEKKNY